MRGSIKHQVATILKKYNAQGISKKEERSKNETKGFNNQKVSPYIHSYESYRAVFSTIKNIAEYAKKHYNVKSIDKIDNNIIQMYFLGKIADGVSYKSISNQVSHLSKVKDEFQYTKDQLERVRFSANGVAKKQNLQPRAYKQTLLDKIKLENSKLQTTFELQRELGLRISAAISINLNNQLHKHQDGYTLTFKEKGGKISEKNISIELVNKIKENSKDGLFNVSQSTYTKSLKKEVIRNGGKWTGTHGMRHSYAQNRLEEGYSKQNVSENMGHIREEITDTYLR